MNVLIIDDEEEIRKILSDILLEEEANVEAVNNGIDGIKYCREHPVDLVIVDILLPGMDGIKVIEEIKKEQPSAYIIGISAHANSRIILQAFKTGAQDFLEKPFSLKDFYKSLNKFKSFKMRINNFPLLEVQFHFPELQEYVPIKEKCNKFIEGKLDLLIIKGEKGTGKKSLASYLAIQTGKKPLFLTEDKPAQPNELKVLLKPRNIDLTKGYNEQILILTENEINAFLDQDKIINLPSLKENYTIFKYFFNYFNSIYGKVYGKAKDIPENIITGLYRFKWEYNIRELKNFIERIYLYIHKNRINEIGELKKVIIDR